MKEEEFLKKLSKIIPELVYNNSLLDSESIEIPIYFTINENGDVLLDFDGMRDEFENKLEKIEEILEEKDELKEIVEEKIEKINDDRAE